MSNDTTPLPHARLAIMGEIDVSEPDGEIVHYQMALLITFTDGDAIRSAIRRGACTFDFGED